MATKKKTRRTKSTDQLRKEAIASIDENLNDAKPKRPRKPPGKTTRKPKSDGKLSGLDAAARILAEAKEPMGCKAIVEQAIEQKLWAPGGRTPHATLYSAMHREIQKKGKGARFEKVDRGRFQLRKGA